MVRRGGCRRTAAGGPNSSRDDLHLISGGPPPPVCHTSRSVNKGFMGRLIPQPYLFQVFHISKDYRFTEVTGELGAYGRFRSGFALFLVRSDRENCRSREKGWAARGMLESEPHPSDEDLSPGTPNRQHLSEPPTTLRGRYKLPTRTKSSETAEIIGKLGKNIVGLE